jgi:superfamily II DNA/RNA helicase
MQSFTDLNLHDVLIDSLAKISITTPTHVQEQVIPLVFAEKNVLFEAETGSGKTYAYALPLIQRIFASTTLSTGASTLVPVFPEPVEGSSRRALSTGTSTSPSDDDPSARNNLPAVCIAAPTHELASQLKKALELIASPLKVSLFIGGVPVKRQIEALKTQKPKIIVGTPARLCELAQLKKLHTRGIHTLVLDEADRLFSRELIESVTELRKLLPSTVQIIASSATIGIKTRQQFSTFAPQHEFVKIEKYDVLKNYIEHQALFSDDRDKVDTLRRYLQAVMPAKTLVFCARLDFVEKVFFALEAKKISCAAIHAKAGKHERKDAMDSFRQGKISLLVASDVSARGLDIPDITHIIQMDMPDAEAFVHRAGRTARAGKRGVNMVIGNAWEMRQYEKLEKQLRIAVYPKMLYEGKLVAADAAGKN